MKIFVQPTLAPEVKTERIRTIALFYAGILVTMVVAQLFSFEKFIPLIESFQLPGGVGAGTLVACLIVVAEVFALPFLLRMRTSPLMRVVSMVCGWLVPLLWLLLALWLNVAVVATDNVGVFGTKLQTPVGWWAVLYSAALGVLAAWASWGMWPLSTPRKTLVKK